MRQESDLAVVVAVRAWEPPILEFVDFVTELRAALGDAVAIIIVPVALGPAGEPAAPLDTDREQWTMRVGSIGDPWLSIRSLDANRS